MRPFRIGLSFPVESDCPVSLRQRLDDEELNECVGSEDGLPLSGDGMGLSDFCKLCLGMDIEVEPLEAGDTAGVLETEVLADVTPEGEDEGEVDDDETSSSNDSSIKSEGGTPISLIA